MGIFLLIIGKNLHTSQKEEGEAQRAGTFGD